MTRLSISLTILLFTLASATNSAPPILLNPLTSQLVPSNSAISSAFLIPPSSALLINASSPFPALRVPPSWSFSIGFSALTFAAPPSGPQTLNYTAQLDNGDAIPDWLNFSPDTLTFGGVTPKDLDIQVLKIQITASSSSGATTSDSFTLIVSLHDLSLFSPLLTRNVTANNAFSIVVDDFQGISIDGSPDFASWALVPDNSNGTDSADATNLTLSLDTSAFTWLKYDMDTCTLSGTPPESLSNSPLPVIPATVRLSIVNTSQVLTVFTNMSLAVVLSLFTQSELPVIDASPGTKIEFDLGAFLTVRDSSAKGVQRRMDLAPIVAPNFNISAAWNPQNATWLTFDPSKLILTGTVPQDAPSKVQATFTAHDEIKGTVSRAEMQIEVGDGDETGPMKLPGDRALRKTGTKIKLAIGVVFGVAAAVILLACFLAICRHCCVSREHVDGAYVIDQSGFDHVGPYKSSLEKQEYTNMEVNAVNTDYLAAMPLPRGPSPLSGSPKIGPIMTKAAFFDAMRSRFGSDGSWRAVGRNRNASGGNSFFGSTKRARKSKISKPMVLLSSSTSIRDGFSRAQRGENGNKGKGTIHGNFTIFGDGNNAGKEQSEQNIPALPPLRPTRTDIPNGVGRNLLSSPRPAVLAYDRTRSNSEPSRNSMHGSAGSPDKRRSGSAPSMATGTRSTTLSTFATGDSARLTNAAGELPLRRPGFDGRYETLAERNMREGGSPLSVETARNMPQDQQGPFRPSRAQLKGAASASALSSNTSQTSPRRPMDPQPPTSQSSDTPPKSVRGASPPQKGDLLNPTMSHSAALPLASSKPGSEKSLNAPSTYRKVFFGDNKGHESDSSGDDADSAIISHVINRSSSETPIILKAGKGTSKAGKPRLVPFTHEKVLASSGKPPRRDISQRAVLEGGGGGGHDSDPEAEMRMGLEYVRQLGDPEANYGTKNLNSDPSRTPSAEFYASNDSNNSIAGRSRVLAPLVINSHRGRHQLGRSMASGHDSFVSSVEREANDQSHESMWMVESSMPRFAFTAKEPFNFAVPLLREHKHNHSALEARKADGRPLPEWLRFDKNGKEFWGVTPKASKGEIIRISVRIWDEENSVVVGGCLVDVTGEAK